MGYENYRDSKIMWLGSIPAHWDVSKAKRYVRITNGSSPTTEGNIPVYGSGKKPFATCGEYKTGPAVLLGRKGTIDNPTYVDGLYWNVDTAFDVKPLNDNFSIKYYYYLATRFDYGFYMTKTAIPSMTQTDYYNIYIPDPPKDEQDQIARFLDWKITAIDKLISIRREELRNLADLKKALITREVTRGNWERVRLGSFCTFQNGISESGDFFTSGTPFVGYKDVYRHSELPETVSGVAMSNEKQQQIFSVQEGDIFFTRTSETIEEIGMAAVCKHTIDKAVFSGFLIRCRPQKNIVDIDYMKYYLQALSVRNYFSSQTNIVIRASLSQNLLKRLPVPCPPTSEQKRIADYLDRICTRIDSAITNFTQQIDTLKELKARLISDTVTGKIDVRNITVPEQEKIS